MAIGKKVSEQQQQQFGEKCTAYWEVSELRKHFPIDVYFKFLIQTDKKIPLIFVF